MLIPSSGVLAEQRIEACAGVGIAFRFNPIAVVETEILAEIADSLVDLPLGLRLTALIVVGRIVEGAVEAAVEIGTALETRIATSDALGVTDVAVAMMAEAHFAYGLSHMADRRNIFLEAQTSLQAIRHMR